MNLGMFARAVRRFRYMHDLPAYGEFLRHLDIHGDVWKVPQAEVAAWWEHRQAAKIQAEASGGGRLHISCSLENAAVEVDCRDLRIPPFELTVSTDVPAGELPITYSYAGEHRPFVDEVLGHLGYGHLSRVGPGGRADIPERQFTRILETLRERALEAARFESEDLDALRSLIRAAHHGRGIPDLRLWTLPHRGGRPYRAAVSVRYDVDRAIINLPAIHELERRHGLKSTAYLRPVGLFYGASQIRRYRQTSEGMETALHGEFVTTAEKWRTDEPGAARREKDILEEMVGREVTGVCMHGGELRTNTTPRTRDAVETAGFLYETMYRNDYYLPLHLPHGNGVRRALSIGQHYADTTVRPGPGFSDGLVRAFAEKVSQAAAEGGVFVPVMHPLYFDLAHYVRKPANLFRLAAFAPRFLFRVARVRRGQQYSNPT